MKAKIIKRFRDKHTKQLFEKGYYEGDKERVSELQKLGYLEKTKAAKEKEKEGE